MPSYGYKIKQKIAIAGVKKELCQSLNLSGNLRHRFKRYYLDSFDWRLLNKGYYLQAEQHDDHIQIQLYRLKDQALISQATTPQLPRILNDITSTKLATLIKPIIDVRALLPRLELDVTQYKLQQRNKQDKITAELDLESIKPLSTQQTQPPIKILWYNPIKGYDKENSAIIKWLNQAEMVQSTSTSLFTELLSQLNIDCSYSSKVRKSFNPKLRTDDEIKQLLDYFLTTMRQNEAGIIEDIDTEFIHDYRIAVRRSRTLLGQVPGIMPQRTLTRFGNHLAQLGSVTTPLRDLDVMLLNFDDYRNLLPEEIRSDLDPAFAFIQQQRQHAYKKVCRYLQSKTYLSFCERWHTYLQNPSPAQTQLINAKKPLKQVADKRTWKAYRKALKQGLAISDDSPADDLHTLRKSCKKLRYLLEFFRSLYSNKKMKELISTLKQLQDNLGEFQDIHVHIDFFRDLSSAMQVEDKLDENTKQAINTVINALDIQQDKCRKEFQSRFKQFSSSQHQHLFEQLFKSP